jgi:YD repeat-containing protein
MSRPLLALAGLIASIVLLASASAATVSASTPVVSYTYDAAGRLATVTDATGDQATYHYDAEGNLLSISYSSNSPHQTAKAPPAAPTPTISAVSPSKVAAGGAITITGSGFAAKRQLDLVRVGGLFAVVTSASSTTLHVSAPPNDGGAVTVRTPSGIARGAKVAITEPRLARNPAPGINRDPLRAAAGVTALSGLVERPTVSRWPAFASPSQPPAVARRKHTRSPEVTAASCCAASSRAATS